MISKKQTADKFKIIKKWQIALRRYVILQKGSLAYTTYFGINSNMFRKWVELLFDKDMSWDNFGTHWKFEHIAPVNYFKLENESELKLCWNFINIRPAALRSVSPDIYCAKNYFKQLYKMTGNPTCSSILAILESAPNRQDIPVGNAAIFLKEHRVFLEEIKEFDEYDFSRLNEGATYMEILLEKKILKKFGS